MIHFKAFGGIFLHNKLDKTYQGGHFHPPQMFFFFFFCKTYFKSPTSSPMHFWHFDCVKYAKTPISETLEWSCQYVSKILKFFGQCVLHALGDRSHHQSLNIWY
jgi:hypothetical protein